jgi:hypothetical protein
MLLAWKAIVTVPVIAPFGTDAFATVAPASVAFNPATPVEILAMVVGSPAVKEYTWLTVCILFGTAATVGPLSVNCCGPEPEFPVYTCAGWKITV